ncbi:MAG: outer membrane receptor for ferric coprogen and ferric-rhodotorulic acid [Rheinheimera aquimaris]|jgi:outer membrane receptor for ferric coprogen and ferric-rhodotorulic acid|tara:strand:+ start:6105 stop:8426 length:2322 start_codon:yes stop_codon:yes gene_type:complete
MLACGAKAGAPSTVLQHYHIRAAQLSECINQLAQAANVFVAFDARLTADKRCKTLSEELTVGQALSRVLSDSGLVFEQVGNRHFVIKPIALAVNSVKAPTEIVVSFTIPKAVSELFTPELDWMEQSSASSGISQTVKQTPQSVTIFNPAKFEPFNQSDLGEVLRSSAGIYSTANAFTGNREFRARGQLLNPFMIDNQPFADANFAVSELDMAYFDVLEITHGTNGVVQDNAVNSASVNLTPKSASGLPAITGTVSSGQLLAHRLSADITGPLTSHWPLYGRAVVVAQQQQDAAEHSENTRYGALLRLSGKLGADTAVDLYHIAQEDRQQQRSKIRPLLYADLTHYDGPLSTNFWPTWSGAEQKMAFSRLSVRQPLTEQWHSRVDISHAGQQQQTLLPDVFGYPDKQQLSLSFGAMSNYFKFSADKVALSLDGSLQMVDMPLDISLAASRAWHRNYQQLQLMDFQGSVRLDPDTFRAMTSNQTAPQFVADSFVNDLDYQTHSLRVSGRIALTNTTLLSATVRRNHSRYNSKGTFALGTEQTQYHNVYIGVSQRIDNAQLYASYADSVDFRQGYLSKLDLIVSPVRFASIEAGLKMDFWQQRCQLSISGYHSSQRRFMSQPGELQPDRHGWDASISYQTSWLQFNASYSRNFSASPSENQIGQTVQFPDSLYRLTVSAALDTLSQDSTVGVAVEGETRQQYKVPAFSGQQWQVVSQPASWRLNSYYRLALGQASLVTLSVKNLLNKAYFDGVDINTGWAAYGAPRHLAITFEQQF